MKNAINLIKKELLNMPKSPGVYRMIDADGEVLYVGKAKDLSKRIANYAQVNRLCNRMKLAISQLTKLEIITVQTEAQALILEANLIKSLKPKYNILLKDDKSMPYILVREDHPYSQLLKFRGNKTVKGQYFGPFASPRIVDQTIEFIEKAFLLRSCSDSFFNSRKTACMQYQIKRCSAPCVNKISAADYQDNSKKAIKFLQGKSIELQQELTSLMNQASNNLEYEKAAKYRDQLKALNYIQNRNVNLFSLEEADVIGIDKLGDHACIQLFLFRNGQNYGNKSIFIDQVEDESIEKILSIFLVQNYQINNPPKDIILSAIPEDINDLEEAFNLNLVIPKGGEKLKVLNFATENAKMALLRKFEEKESKIEILTKVQKLFNVKNKISRIEVYDNSHISGAMAVGAMIVATEDGFSKKHYRKYNIKSNSVGDDYMMMKEVLTRRLVKKENLPDLIIVDGGQGHLGVAVEVLNHLRLDIALVCMSKGVDRNAGKEIFHQKDKEPFTLDKNDELMKYLQIIRDEAHRFAIESHRKKRKMAINVSTLTKIPGVGAKRRKILVDHFTSLEEIKRASVEQLIKLDGISKKIAEEIKEFFDKNG